ncbi:unnamed protein product [Prorocentrum cordatum]|uniref:Uncharacterized protein n=1 Tax=Prorocentrum cordatum TaxID=2364126 RepID=A0ABN9U8J9_9DINO|nr:unnamed protein product [Polarella glacialis]
MGSCGHPACPAAAFPSAAFVEGLFPSARALLTEPEEVWTEYTTEYPRVIVHPLDTTKFQLTMNETRIFNLTAPSRTARDLVALTVRCMHARRGSCPPSPC